MAKATQTEIHDRVAPAIVNRIMTAVMQDAEGGGGPQHIMLMTESIVLGIINIIAQLDPAIPVEAALDEMIAHVKQRRADWLLLQAPPAGSA